VSVQTDGGTGGLRAIQSTALYALEDVRAYIPATHKAMLAVRMRDELAIIATLGFGEDRDLVGCIIPLGDGFIGWAAASGGPQIRANMEYSPPDTPSLTDAERSLAAKSGMVLGVGEGDGSFVLSALVCHGEYVFSREDMSALMTVGNAWRDRLEKALATGGSLEWLESLLPADVQEPPEAEATAEPAGAAAAQPSRSDYTDQDLDVLLSVFGLDVTTKNKEVARVLKADVGEFVQRDVRDIFGAPGPTPADQPAQPASAEPPRPAEEASQTPVESATPDAPGGGESYTTEDVGRVLSVFGIKVNAADTPFSRALGIDVGDIFKPPPDHPETHGGEGQA
jgi:hypothetical protein